MHKKSLVFLTVLAVASTCSAQSATKSAPRAKQTIGKPEIVAQFRGAMPTGVTVSASGRIFTNFPRWGDDVKVTVAEVKNGRAVPFPNAQWNRRDIAASRRFVSVQSVVIDPKDRLWALDTGSVAFGPVIAGGPKLVCVNLANNRVEKVIQFPSDVALKLSYLNDVRFDLRRGKAGMAFITDSSGPGSNGIIVVDLESGKSWRKLNDHPSTKAVQKFVPMVENRALMQRKPGEKVKYVGLGSDGIAISADGQRLFYCPLSSRRLYSVSVEMLAKRDSTPAEVAATVIDHGDKGASDGLESDNRNGVYCTNYENNAILRRDSSGMFETIVAGPQILWPDTLCVARDGYLYFTVNQLHRQPSYHFGHDLRVKPYSIMRVKINAGPVSLK